MRKLIVLITLTAFLSMGCAMSQVNPDYQAYVQAIQSQANAQQKSLTEIEVDSSGKISKIVLNQPYQVIPVQQKAPHPAWALAGSAVNTLGAGATIVLGIRESGKALGNIIEAGNGSTSIVNSGANSGNSGTVSLTEMAPAAVIP